MPCSVAKDLHRDRVSQPLAYQNINLCLFHEKADVDIAVTTHQTGRFRFE